MKIRPTFVLISALLLPHAFAAKKPAAEYPATYTGGTLPLDHHRLRAAFDNGEVVFLQGDRRIAVPVNSITAISCGTELKHRASISLHLGAAENYYVGVAYTSANGNDSQAQVLLKLSRTEYRDFLAALEKVTGRKAIDTNQVPTVVRYPA